MFLSPEEVVYGVGGTVVGLSATGLAKKMPLPNKSKNSKRIDNNKNKDTEPNNINTKHKKTPEEVKSQSTENLKEGRASYMEYNKNNKISQEKSFKENSNLLSLKKTKDTTKIDRKKEAGATFKATLDGVAGT